MLGVAALFIASKYEETCPPSLKEFIDLKKDEFSKNNIKAMENEILFTIDYNLRAPSASSFLQIFQMI